MIAVFHDLTVALRSHHIEPVRQFVGRTVRRGMRCKHGSTAFDAGGEAGGDLAGTHVADQGVDRRLPFRLGHLLGNALVGNDARIMLGERHIDQDTGAIFGVADAPYKELLERGAVCTRPLQGARNQRRAAAG